MDTLAAQLRTEGWGNTVEPVSVCLVSEDLVTASRGEAFLKALAACVPTGVSIIKRTWSLNELKLPRLRGIAAADAGLAKWVILSLHHTRELPVHATAWLSAMGQTRTGKGGTLVALLGSACGEDCLGLRNALQHAAGEARMRFLLYVGSPEDAGSEV